MWQQNLFNNLIVVVVLLGLFVIVYCRIKQRTMVELFKEIREIISPTEIIA